ncbi:hypothetical protein [Janthinobacterium agaricidamnosum]|uniref:Domain protein n=1 Tax=Janthinobacterium agaricidamnosum NBRC 102515 = DSM 9628 TaxID=1349767 RepID=W0V288_9BURK|nr:hypothetical protein [Janthinobacterium agaricidamnosum]CDG81750.1 domain protein [Janthinobacterium agaricidamnosum NBRC 102515 = DSM 9628]
MNQPVFDASIPVLTEVLSAVAEAAEPAAEMAANAAAMAPPADCAGQLESETLHRWDEQQWALLEQRLTERILRQLQGKIDFVLEQCMAQVLRQALDNLSGDIRNGLQETMEQIVSGAVSEELMQLKTLKK